MFLVPVPHPESAPGPNMEHYLEEQQQAYGGSEYGIDWEEVKGGTSAGMPGRWVSLARARELGPV